MAIEDWTSYIAVTNRHMDALRKAIPATAAGFRDLAVAATAPGALDPKTKELMAIALSIAAHCDGCIGFHVKAAIKHGATRDEVAEAIGMAVYMGGGPSMIYGAEALEAFDQLSE